MNLVVVFACLVGIAVGFVVGYSTLNQWCVKGRVIAYIVWFVVLAIFLVLNVVKSGLSIWTIFFPYLFWMLGLVIGGEIVPQKNKAPK